MTELDQVRTFYGSVLGFESIPIEGDEFGVEALILGARVRAIVAPGELPGSWIAFFNVSNVDSSFSLAAEMGAQALGEPFDTTWDRSVVLEDPTGARFGLTSTTSLAGSVCCHAIPRRIGHAGCAC
jgi:predicted enzyme related to lactoylglutathione lyase